MGKCMLSVRLQKNHADKYNILCAISKLTLIFYYQYLIVRLVFHLSLFLNSNQGMHSAILYYISGDCNCLHSTLKLRRTIFIKVCSLRDIQRQRGTQGQQVIGADHRTVKTMRCLVVIIMNISTSQSLAATQCCHNTASHTNSSQPMARVFRLIILVQMSQKYSYLNSCLYLNCGSKSETNPVIFYWFIVAKLCTYLLYNKGVPLRHTKQKTRHLFVSCTNILFFGCCIIHMLLFEVLLVLALASEVSGGRRRYGRRKYGRKYSHRQPHRHVHSHHHTKEYYEPSYERQRGAPACLWPLRVWCYDAQFVASCDCECKYFWYFANIQGFRGDFLPFMIVIRASLDLRVASVWSAPT